MEKQTASLLCYKAANECCKANYVWLGKIFVQIDIGRPVPVIVDGSNIRRISSKPKKYRKNRGIYFWFVWKSKVRLSITINCDRVPKYAFRRIYLMKKILHGFQGILNLNYRNKVQYRFVFVLCGKNSMVSPRNRSISIISNNWTVVLLLGIINFNSTTKIPE